jgi:anti-sigma factor RsiW
MLCSEAQRVQAYFDGELDAGASAVIEQHLAHCAGCAALMRDLQSTRDVVREEGSYYRASPKLHSQVTGLLDRETGKAGVLRSFLPRDRTFWLGLATGIVPTALAAALVFFVYLGPAPDQLTSDLMSAHLRSLVANHLIDVASSDQHTVKPWFAGHADVSPPAVDFPKENYRLVGGRTDYVDGRRAAVVVYRHGAHVINVFAWPQNGSSMPNLLTRDGYHIACWRNGDLAFCAVSDTALDELLALTRLLKDIKA